MVLQMAGPIPRKDEKCREVECEGQVTSCPKNCKESTRGVLVWRASSAILRGVQFVRDRLRKDLWLVKVERIADVYVGPKSGGRLVGCAPRSPEYEMVVLRSL